ncbi:unnamed protein product [Triticum turgidum subsp. durum]|uniref:Uncharacterized protein n=1 Tax=Triticum turgidum subsp. durum TaxID=4567 RepID=A0A9R0Q8E5_TRITD|nr:unnamed protein product [Triticum turgidum subsp. durum]
MASVEVRSVRKSAALRPRGPTKVQPARSMSLDYKYSAARAGVEAGPAANGVGRRAAAAAADEEGEAVPPERDADSPYSSKATTTEEEESAGGGGEVDSASSAAATPRRPSPTAAAGPSPRDTRWGDTSSYGAKKA